ncbi:MAG TPA: Gfo/Idh/MocA family oxidoreductase [Candidatus Brocadiia bacterium]|nr:Gfo/Idh/MocA family oxidoreductase [Candidatus Brocadiia bacterium]
MRKVNAAVIGTGFIGPAHVEALRRLGFVDVIALGEANEELAKKKAADMSIPRAYGDFKKLLADPDIEVIHNCTPNNMHFQISSEALKAGKHVVSEKPLAMTSKESAKLIELAAKTGLVNAIDFNYRSYPLVQEAADMVRRGDFGRLYSVHGSYLQDWLFWETDYNWRLEPERSGASRAIADIGSHWCDLIQFITGDRIVELFADIATVHPFRKKPKKDVETYTGKALKPSDYEDAPIKTEDYASVLLRFAGGAKGVFTVSQVSAGRKNRLWFELDGSKRAIWWDQERPNEMTIGYREKANEVIIKDPSLLSARAKEYAAYPGGHPEGYPDGPKFFFRDVYAYIIGGCKCKPRFATFEDGHHEILMTEAVLKSAKTSKWVKLGK